MTTVLGSTLTPEDRETIRSLTEQHWTAAGLARDWDKTLAICAPDIVYMPADHPILRGQTELRAWLEQFPPILKFTQPLESVEGQGHLAIAHSAFAVTVDVAGQLIENTGKALCEWQKNSSGQWVVKAVCWNWNRPLGAAS